MERFICLAIGYAFGLFQTGYLYGKKHDFDIRNHGSGNAGTTNVLRTMGLKAGVFTFLGDAFKCVFAVLLVRVIYRNSYPDMLPLLSLYAGFGAVLGHNYPFYMNFKGGKGIAVTAGMILCTDWRITLVCLLIFGGVVAVTRYVSLGSLLISIAFLVGVVILGQAGEFGMSAAHLTEMYGIGVLFVISAFWRHRTNIKRLLSGNENKISLGKKEGRS